MYDEHLDLSLVDEIVPLISKTGANELDVEEFQHLLYVLINKPLETHGKKMFLLADIDGSGDVSIEELVVMMLKNKIDLPKEKIHQIVVGVAAPPY